MNMVEKEEGRYRGSTRVGPSAAYLGDLRELQAREWALIKKAFSHTSIDLVARPKIRVEGGGLAGVNVAAVPAVTSSTTSFGEIPKVDRYLPFVPKLKTDGHFDITSESAGNASDSASSPHS